MTPITNHQSPTTIGITGSLASGKSFVLSIFEKLGAATQNSDIIVHELIAGEASEEIKKQFPEAADNGKINRKKLGAIVFSDQTQLKKLEAILHPRVREKNLEFIKTHQDKKIIALEIPLLFETGAEIICDYVIFVEAPLAYRRKRAFEREGMSDEVFDKVTNQQWPDAQKKDRSDFVINNSTGSEVEKQIEQIIKTIGRPCVR